MKNQKQNPRNRTGLKSIFTRFSLLMFTFATISCMNAQLPSNGACRQIRTVVQTEVVKKGKVNCDSTVLYVAAIDANNAFMQAQNLCIRLNAEWVGKQGASSIYVLPGESGKLTLTDKENNPCVYSILYLDVNCGSYPVREIRFLRLKCYKEIKE